MLRKVEEIVTPGEVEDPVRVRNESCGKGEVLPLHWVIWRPSTEMRPCVRSQIMETDREHFWGKGMGVERVLKGEVMERRRIIGK
jgi:hypothetical protein